MNKSILLILVVLFPMAGLAQTMTTSDLEGRWEFVSWEEEGDPTSKQLIGLMMDFNADGTVVSHMPDGPSEASFTINDDTIYYVDDKGKQTWKVISHTPDESFIVNNRGSIMVFERPQL